MPADALCAQPPRASVMLSPNQVQAGWLAESEIACRHLVPRECENVDFSFLVFLVLEVKTKGLEWELSQIIVSSIVTKLF